MPGLTPRDPDWRQRLAESFARQSMMETLGARLGASAPGVVEIEAPFAANLAQQHGYLHAGVVATCLDSACGYAAFTLAPALAEVLTVEFKSSFLAPAAGEAFRFRGEALRPGRTITATEGKAFAIKDGEETLIATMSATIMTVGVRGGAAGPERSET